MCGDRVYIGSASAYTTAYASRFNGFDIPAVRCVRSLDGPAPVLLLPQALVMAVCMPIAGRIYDPLRPRGGRR